MPFSLFSSRVGLAGCATAGRAGCPAQPCCHSPPAAAACRVGFSVRDADGSWQQVPICYPMRCAGLWAVSGDERAVLYVATTGSLLHTAACWSPGFA